MLKPYADLLAGDLPYQGTQAEYVPDPIAVGAVGGSGTRVVAQVLAEACVAMGAAHNVSNDAVEWPPLEKFLRPAMLDRYSRATVLRNAFNLFEKLLYLRRETLGLSGRIGWKVPGTHLWLEELAAYFPQMQYVHVIRHGLDMAYSSNQRQLRVWGHLLGIEARFDADNRAAPADALEFWLRANEAAIERADRLLNGRFFLLRFEELCDRPERELRRLFDFLGVQADDEQLAGLAAQIRSPKSRNRYQRQTWRDDFSDQQLQRLAALGYTAAVTEQAGS
jgi:hypothetical protein